MSLTFNLVSNIGNGVGLQRDYELLRDELLKRGHKPYGIQFDRPGPRHLADVNIFLETVVESVIPWASRQWAIPNPEWWFSNWPIQAIDQFLLKTHDAYTRFERLRPGHCTYIGWQAVDMLRRGVQRIPSFLHVQGKSQMKNTEAVIAGCMFANAPLTVISQKSGHISEEELIWQMNHHLFHILPAAYEGYGQALHESTGVGAVIITTDAPPMNEIKPAIYIPTCGHSKCRQGTLYKVNEHDVTKAVRKVLALTSQQIADYTSGTRKYFEEEQRFFHQKLDEVLADA